MKFSQSFKEFWKKRATHEKKKKKKKKKKTTKQKMKVRVAFIWLIEHTSSYCFKASNA
jgi:hypothetical protein